MPLLHTTTRPYHYRRTGFQTSCRVMSLSSSRPFERPTILYSFGFSRWVNTATVHVALIIILLCSISLIAFGCSLDTRTGTATLAVSGATSFVPSGVEATSCSGASLPNRVNILPGT